MPLNFESLDWFYNWVQQPTWKLVGLIFVNGLWLPIFWIFLKEVWEAFQFWTSGFWSEQNRRHMFLAVDVPADTEQTPAAMEAIFNQLAGAHGTSTWVDAKWKGEFLDWFSFEIVSLDGYVQYLIRTPIAFRDLVEASVYAQYPDAEISEVSDYVQDVPSQYPNEEWDFFGTGYNLQKHEAYPIRTYNEFEDKIKGELIDTMAGLLEIMSKIGKGEQIWYQILAKPIVDPDWLPGAEKEIDKVVDRYKEPERGGILGFLLNIPHLLNEGLAQAFGWELVGGGGADSKESDLAKSPMFKLTPGERAVLEDMERKTGKLAYKCRIRIAYFAKRNVISKARGVNPVVGAIKQFNDGSKNPLMVEKRSWTKANYFFKKARTYQRQNNYYQAYANRSMYAGDTPGGFVLNSEELATLYHFPMFSVKAPMVKRTGSKKSEPPSTLPTGEIGGLSINISDLPEPPGIEGRKESALDKVKKSQSTVIEESNDVEPEQETTPQPLPEPEEPEIQSNIVDESQVKYIEIPDDK